MTNFKRNAGQELILEISLMKKIAQVQTGEAQVAPVIGEPVAVYRVLTNDPDYATARAKKEATREGRDHANTDKFYWTTPEPLEGKVLK